MKETVFYFVWHIYPPFTRNQIVSLYFGRDVRTRLGLTICDVPGPPVFHIKAETFRLVPCPRTQAKLPAYSPQPPPNAERQARKLWIPFFKILWYDLTWAMNPRATDCEADALTTTPVCLYRRFYLVLANRGCSSSSAAAPPTFK